MFRPSVVQRATILKPLRQQVGQMNRAEMLGPSWKPLHGGSILYCYNLLIKQHRGVKSNLETGRKSFQRNHLFRFYKRIIYNGKQKSNNREMFNELCWIISYAHSYEDQKHGKYLGLNVTKKKNAVYKSVNKGYPQLHGYNVPQALFWAFSSHFI